MSTVNTRVLISNEQRAQVLKIDRRHPGRSVSRSVRLGFEFIHTPLADFAMITFCLDGTIIYANETAKARAERLRWQPDGDELYIALDRDFYAAAVKHFTALRWQPTIGFSICLWYGLMAYHCKIRSLREALWSNYPRRKDDLLSKLLSDGVTYAGMAYLAGTAGTSNDLRCASCYFYQERRNMRGEELEGSCDKYASLMGTGPKPRFPSHARACKYHEERNDHAQEQG